MRLGFKRELPDAILGHWKDVGILKQIQLLDPPRGLGQQCLRWRMKFGEARIKGGLPHLSGSFTGLAFGFLFYFPYLVS